MVALPTSAHAIVCSTVKLTPEEPIGVTITTDITATTAHLSNKTNVLMDVIKVAPMRIVDALVDKLPEITTVPVVQVTIAEAIARIAPEIINLSIVVEVVPARGTVSVLTVEEPTTMLQLAAPATQSTPAINND